MLSGHSFQALLTENDRLNLLKNIENHLKDNGTFVFDSRNPLVQEWTTWGEKDSIRYFKHLNYGIIKAWNDWEAKKEIYSLIDQAGLSVKHLYCDWQ